jgi:hypothetical protein
MDITSFHKLRTAVQQNAHPADDLTATRLRTSLHTALTASRLFGEIEFGQTDDPDQMVIGVCRCSDDVLPWEAGMGVERLWLSVASDVKWEAHTVGCTDTLMEFEGAVTVDDSGHYVTVHVVAEPSAATMEVIVARADAARAAAAEAAEAPEESAVPVGAEAEPARG